MATKRAKTADSALVSTAITSIKGFDADLSCRGFQFEAGKTFEVSGKIEACSNGFHACPVDEHPLSVFEFYPPAGKRFFLVEQAGETDKQETKLASAKITIGVELSLGGLTKRAIDWVFARANWKDGPVATADNEGATASGYQGAATASGDQGAATASGYQGAATASGTRGAATASGTRGAATASGYLGKVSGKEGNALFLVERDRWDGPVLNVWAGVVGKDGIKPETFYTLRNGKPVEAEE
jgi:hypothetical protein